MSLVEVRGLSFGYGGANEKAVADLDLDVAAGELVVLGGPSGCGKSTLLRAVSGLVPHFHGGEIRGEIRVAGRDPIREGPSALAGTVASLFQDPETQGVYRTAARDVAFGPHALGLDHAAAAERTAWALELCAAHELSERELATLSAGERQRVALAGAVAMKPQLLLLDEPTAQLDSGGIAALRELVQRLRADGTTVLVAEHRPERWQGLGARRIDLAEARRSQRGGDAPASRPAASLELRALTLIRGERIVIDSCDLTVAAGSFTAITGPNGSGKTTLLRTLAGLDAPAGGSLHMDGNNITDLPAERRFPDIAFVPHSCARTMLTERVVDEIAVGLPSVERDHRVADAARRCAVDHLCERHPLDLSVGERERVALAGALAASPRVLLLDEPSRALDDGALGLLVELIVEATESGTTVVAATHDERLLTAIDGPRVDLSLARSRTPAVGAT